MRKILTIGIVTYNNDSLIELLFNKLAFELRKSPGLEDEVDVLVYDDNSSSENQIKILDKFDTKFNIYRSSLNSKGPSAGRNHIINNSKTDYLLFIDGDDIFLGSLKSLVDEIKTKTGDILVSNVKKVLNDGVIANSPFVMSKKLFSNTVNPEDYAKYTVHQTGIWSVYRTEFLKENQIKYENDVRYEDNYFMSRIYLSNPKIDILKNEYYGWRTNYSSFSYTGDSIEHRIKIYDKILGLLANNPKNKNAPFLLDSIWNQTYGNLIRNYQKFSFKKNQEIFKEYEKITKKHRNTIKQINRITPEYKVGMYFKYINRFYNCYAMFYVYKCAFKSSNSSGEKTKLLVNVFKTLLPTQNKVFFTSHYGSYSDNPKYLYLEMKKDPKYKNTKFVFAVKDPKLLKNKDFIDYNNKLKYYYNFYTAKEIYFNTWQSPLLKKKKNQKFIQLWHGKPYKKVYTDVPTYRELNSEHQIKEKQEAINRWDYCYSVDQENTKIFKRLFPNCEIKEEIYPKTRWLIKNQNNNLLIQELYKKYKLDPKKQYTLYAPTYRLYESVIDIEKINKLKSENHELLIHMHPLSKYEFTNEKNINYQILKTIDDIQELILLTQELITDYSSIQYDYKMLDKKVLYYKFDEQMYDTVSGLYLEDK